MYRFAIDPGRAKTASSIHDHTRETLHHPPTRKNLADQLPHATPLVHRPAGAAARHPRCRQRPSVASTDTRIGSYRRIPIQELYSGWRRVERQALADGARKRVEVLWIKTP